MAKTAGKGFVDNNVTEKCLIVSGMIGNRTNWNKKSFVPVRLGYKVAAFNLTEEELLSLSKVCYDVNEISKRLSPGRSYWQFCVDYERLDELRKVVPTMYRHIYSASELDGIQNENAREYMLENYERYPFLYDKLEEFEWVDPENFERKSNIGWRGEKMKLNNGMKDKTDAVEKSVELKNPQQSQSSAVRYHKEALESAFDKARGFPPTCTVLTHTKDDSVKTVKNKKYDGMEWAVMAGYDGRYEISRSGFLRLSSNHRPVRKYRKNDGFCAVKLNYRNDARTFEHRVRDLLLATFKEIPNEYIDNDSDCDEWRVIDGYDGNYEVSSKGLVRSVRKDIPFYLAQKKDQRFENSYTVNLHRDGKVETKYVYSLVKRCFGTY